MKTAVYAAFLLVFTLPGMCQQEIKISDGKADAPEFKRLYVVRLNNDVVMTITCKRSRFLSLYPNGVECIGQLRQSDGKWVLFEPERPADKILQTEIVSAVKKFVPQIMALDKAYRDSDPKEFIDENGSRWRKISPVPTQPRR